MQNPNPSAEKSDREKLKSICGDRGDGKTFDSMMPVFHFNNNKSMIFSMKIMRIFDTKSHNNKSNLIKK